MRMLFRLLLVLALAFAGVVLWLAVPQVSLARLPARAAVLPAYSQIYLAPAQVRGATGSEKNSQPNSAAHTSAVYSNGASTCASARA